MSDNMISKIKIGNIEYELGTSIDNVDGLRDALDSKIENVVKYDVAQNLTDEQKAQARENIGVDDVNVEIDEITVQLGTNGTVGGYKTGDVIAAGTDINDILNKLFQKSVHRP